MATRRVAIEVSSPRDRAGVAGFAVTAIAREARRDGDAG
jgi:hypothetical protein